MKERLAIPGLVALAFALQNLVVPAAFKGDVAVAADTVIWLALIAGCLGLSSLLKISPWQGDRLIVALAVLIGTFQVFLGVFAGFFVGFARPTWNWSIVAITVQLPFLVIALVGTEMARASMAVSLGNRGSTSSLLLTSLFFALVGSTLSAYSVLTTPLSVAEFLMRTFLPALAFSVLATYFAYLGGFPCNMALMGTMALFSWFSPVLPDISWTLSSLISILVAATGFFMLDRAAKPMPEHRVKRFGRHKGELPFLTVIAVVALIGVWSSAGFLGFTPTVIGSGSMSPSIRPGDIVFVVKVPVQALKVGDVIQYAAGQGLTVVHRLQVIQGSPGGLVLVTKGDANRVPDEPIMEGQVMGRVVLTVPYLGWAALFVQEGASRAVSFLEGNLLASLLALSFGAAGVAVWERRVRNDPVRRLRRELAI